MFDGIHRTVQSLDASRQTFAGRQVDVLEGGAVLQQAGQRLHVDRAAAQVHFPANKNEIKLVGFQKCVRHGTFSMSKYSD